MEKEKKRGGCLKNILIGFIILIVLGSCAALFGDDEEESDSETTGHSAEDQAEMDRQQKEHDEKARKEEEKKVAEEQAEQERIEKEEAEKQKAEEEEKEPEYEIIDGAAVFTKYEDFSLSVNMMISSFSMDMTEALKEHHSEIENGAVFRLANPLEDKYGNEEKTFTVVAYYSQDTIEKINYDNWPALVSSGLYDTADSVFVHYALNDNKHAQGKGSENAPDFVQAMFGAKYEE